MREREDEEKEGAGRRGVIAGGKGEKKGGELMEGRKGVEGGKKGGGGRGGGRKRCGRRKGWQRKRVERRKGKG